MNQKQRLTLTGIGATILIFSGLLLPGLLNAKNLTQSSMQDNKSVLKSSSKETTNKKTNSKKSSKIVSPEKAKAWYLTLVGPYNKISKEIDESSLETLSDGARVDKRIAPNVVALKQAASAAGFNFITISSYRSVAAQEETFNARVNRLMSENGLSKDEATEETKTSITVPGYSEHHTGLALDLVTDDWYYNNPSAILDEKFGDTPGGKWLAANAATYGFIIRYPKDKEKITGITYEPWHIRYVGKEDAEFISKNNLTLEEFLKK